MKPGSRLEMLAIDVVGACLVGACVAAFFWLMVGKSDMVRDEIRKASSDLASAETEFSRLRIEHSTEHANLADRKAQQARIGKLPSRAPTEQYFQSLSQLAVSRHLKVLQHNPLASVEYPGLLEQRFTYEVAGEWPNIVLFLRDIELSDAWADVAYLKVSHGGKTAGNESNERPVALTISMFSAMPLQKGDAPTGV